METEIIKNYTKELWKVYIDGLLDYLKKMKKGAAQEGAIKTINDAVYSELEKIFNILKAKEPIINAEPDKE